MIGNEEGGHRNDDRLFSFVGYFGVTTFPLFVDFLLLLIFSGAMTIALPVA